MRTNNTLCSSLLGLVAALTCLSAGAASTPVAKPADFREFFAMERAAEDAFLADCTAKSRVYRLLESGDHADLHEFTWTIKPASGACRDGKRDGATEFTFTRLKRVLRQGKLVRMEQSTANWRGEFVAGVQAGLWCRGPEIKSSAFGKDKPKRVESFDSSTPLCGFKGGVIDGDKFMRRADGRWQRVNFTGSLGLLEELVPEGTLEEHSRAIIESHRTGGQTPRMSQVIEIPQLADLVPQGKLWFDQRLYRKTGVPLAGGRVALIFTTRTAREIEHFDAERKRIAAATATLRGSAPGEYLSFLQASEPQRLIDALVQSIRPQVGTLVPTDDLAALVEGAVDYAIVVDCRPEFRANVLGNYDAVLKAHTGWTPPEVFQTRVAFLMLDRNLRVMASFNRDGGLQPRGYLTDFVRKPFSGDREYLFQLAARMQDQWALREPVDNAFGAIHMELAGFRPVAADPAASDVFVETSSPEEVLKMRRPTAGLVPLEAVTAANQNYESFVATRPQRLAAAKAAAERQKILDAEKARQEAIDTARFQAELARRDAESRQALRDSLQALAGVAQAYVESDSSPSAQIVADTPNYPAPVQAPEVGTAERVKRSNVPEANATHCLAPQKEGGVINNCDFAIEYIYCVVQPAAGSWSASFDCHQGKSGSWQVGPHSRAIMHTGGAQVAFFGCRYGPTLAQSEGISPADFRLGTDGMPTGRCKEWGAP